LSNLHIFLIHNALLCQLTCSSYPDTHLGLLSMFGTTLFCVMLYWIVSSLWWSKKIWVIALCWWCYKGV